MRLHISIVLSIAAIRLTAQDALPFCERYAAADLNASDHVSDVKEPALNRLQDLRRRLGPEDPERAMILICVGDLRLSEQKYFEADVAFQESLKISEKLFGTEDRQVAFVLFRLGRIKHTEGYYEAAESLYERAHTILEKNLGPHSEGAALVEAALAKLYLAEHRSTEAEKLLEKAIPVLEKTADHDVTPLAVALTNLAGAYQLEGQYRKAEPIYVGLVRVLESRPSIVNPEIRAGLRAYLQMLRKTKRKMEARGVELQLKTFVPR